MVVGGQREKGVGRREGERGGKHLNVDTVEREMKWVNRKLQL